MRRSIILVSLVLFGQSLWAQQMGIGELFSALAAGNATLRSQRAAVEAAEAGVKAAKAARLPDVSAQAAVSYNGDGTVLDRDFGHAQRAEIPSFGNSFALEAQQVVYSGGAISSGIRMAELSQEKAQNGLELTRQQLSFVALGQYLDLYRIDNQMRVYEQNIALTKRLIADVQAKFEQGTALKNDITQHELLLETQKLELTRLGDQRTILNHQLCTTLGMDDRLIVPDTTLADRIFGTDGEALWQERAAAQAVQVRQSDLDVALAEQQLRLSKSESLPKVALVAADVLNGPITIEIPAIDKNFNYWYVGVGVKYAISSLFKNNHKVRQAQLQLNERQEQATAAREQVENAVQQAYTLYEQSYVALQTQRKKVELARENYSVINDRYLNDLALVTDMTNAENLRLQAELDEVNARINVAYAFYRVKFASGTLFE